VAGEYGLVDPEGVEDRDVVRRPGRNVVAVGGWLEEAILGG
jgi:hypothetical protein